MTDLPVVNSKQQCRPSLKAKAVAQLVNESAGEEQALYVLVNATGLRISEALAAFYQRRTHHRDRTTGGSRHAEDRQLFENRRGI